MGRHRGHCCADCRPILGGQLNTLLGGHHLKRSAPDGYEVGVITGDREGQRVAQHETKPRFTHRRVAEYAQEMGVEGPQVEKGLVDVEHQDGPGRHISASVALERCPFPGLP